MGYDKVVEEWTPKSRVHSQTTDAGEDVKAYESPSLNGLGNAKVVLV